jgi:NTE family protein
VLSRPDIVVLGGGGVLGGAWMAGVLSGLEDAAGFDLRRCEYFVGTSAGAILAALLAAGRRPERPRQPRGAGADLDAQALESPAGARVPGRASEGPIALDSRLARRAGAWALALGSPLAPAALGLSAPGGALLRAALLRVVPEAWASLAQVRELVQRSEARFDGRLRVVAVDRRSGRRVVFGRPGAPRAAVGAAVEASCAIPGAYRPVIIGAREYVDGGVWSPTNLDVAPAGRESQVLCLAPIAAVASPAPGPLLAALGRGAVRSAILVEELALRRRGASVRTVLPDAASVAAIGPSLMAREPRERVLAAGYAQGLTLGAGDTRSASARTARSR